MKRFWVCSDSSQTFHPPINTPLSVEAGIIIIIATVFLFVSFHIISTGQQLNWKVPLNFRLKSEPDMAINPKYHLYIEMILSHLSNSFFFFRRKKKDWNSLAKTHRGMCFRDEQIILHANKKVGQADLPLCQIKVTLWKVPDTLWLTYYA